MAGPARLHADLDQPGRLRAHLSIVADAIEYVDDWLARAGRHGRRTRAFVTHALLRELLEPLGARPAT